MKQFGLAPAAPLAALTIAMEFVASLMIVTGFYRWLGALMLAGFTALASFLADRFWATPKTAAHRGRECLLRALGPGRRLPAGGLA